MNIEQTVCFTGHRKINEPLEEIENRLIKAVKDCINIGATGFITGGAIGFDTLAAKVILRLRSEEFPQIKLKLALPCPPEQQTAKWNEQQKQEYKEIYEQADDVNLVSPLYTRGCMFARNRFMVDNSSVVISYLREQKGGTFYTYKYAMSKEKDIVEL